MRYFIRSLKYFFYFSFWTAVIVLALVATGLAEGNINDIFEGGWNALWKIAIFFALVAAVYPKVGFITRAIDTDKTIDDIRDIAVNYMSAKGYVLEDSSTDLLTFRYRGLAGKLTRMYEDRITITRAQGGLTMEGLRKDVMKTATGLEYKINDCQS